MNPVFRRIRDVLADQRWEWGWTAPRSPSYADVEEFATSLVRSDGSEVSSGGILITPSVMEGEYDVFVQVGEYVNGSFREVALWQQSD